MRNSTSKSKKERGFTLIEIIVVIIILGVLITFLSGSIFSNADTAKAKLNLAQLQKVKALIDRYRLEYNSLPGSIEDLTRCNERTGPACIPSAKMEDLNDLFGAPLRYVLEGGRTYRLTTLGADSKEGGDGANSDVTIQGP
jgi:general secretion pathway protein G